MLKPFYVCLFNHFVFMASPNVGVILQLGKICGLISGVIYDFYGVFSKQNMVSLLALRSFAFPGTESPSQNLVHS